MTNENQKNMAAIAAHYKTKHEFGRAPQARVANLLEKPGEFKRTNNAAIYFEEQLQTQINNFSVDLGKTLQSFGSKETVKSALNNVIEQLGLQINEQEEGTQVGGGFVSLTLNVPLWVGKLVLAVLKVVVFAISLFFALVITIATDGNATALSSITNNFFGNKKPQSNQKVQEWAPKSVKTRRNRK